MTTFAAAWVAAFLVGSPASATGGKTAAEKTMTHASFECAIPKGWSGEKQPDGVSLFGGKDKNGVLAQITLRYVAPGGADAKDADAYLQCLTKPSALDVPGWKTGPVTSTTVAGRKAKRVERDTSEFVPPSSTDTKEVPMKELHVVVPAAKGFHTLVYYVPASLDKKSRPAFEAVLKSFKPKP